MHLARAGLDGEIVGLGDFTAQARQAFDNVIGILAAQIVNWQIAQPVAAEATTEMIRDSWNGQAGWRWMFGVEK